MLHMMFHCDSRVLTSQIGCFFAFGLKVLLCFLGSCLVAFQTPTDASTWAVHSTYTGEALALLAAALFSLCSVLLEHQSGRDFDPGLFLGLNRSRERIWEGLKGEDVQM